jgi:hypothetical protein
MGSGMGGGEEMGGGGGGAEASGSSDPSSMSGSPDLAGMMQDPAFRDQLAKLMQVQQMQSPSARNGPMVQDDDEQRQRSRFVTM